MQMEQPKNDMDLDQDADLAYNSLKVRLELSAHGGRVTKLGIRQSGPQLGSAKK